MTAIVLARQVAEYISDADKMAARRVLFGIVDGLSDHDKRQWRRVVSSLMQLEAGELVTMTATKARSPSFHRRHMQLEVRVFEAQETFAVRKGFVDWLKVGAGHCEWGKNKAGDMVARPLSRSYEELDDFSMREYHEAAITFLRSDYAARALWPHLPAVQRASAIEAVLEPFGE